MNYCIVFFPAQPNIKQNIKMKLRGDYQRFIYVLYSNTDFKTTHPEDISSFSFLQFNGDCFHSVHSFKKGMNGRRKRETKGWREEGKERRGRKKSRGGEGREESRQAEV